MTKSGVFTSAPMLVLAHREHLLNDFSAPRPQNVYSLQPPARYNVDGMAEVTK